MPTITWYINRFKNMSLAEVAYRARKISINTLQSKGYFRCKYSKPIVKETMHAYVVPEIENVDVYVRGADRIVAGNIDIFSLKNYQFGPLPEWNKDPLTGVVAPLVFGKRLDYRNESLVGNIKYLWEPNRHLFLVTLAQAYALTSNHKYLNSIKAYLSSWIEQCPYLMGANWVSSLELAIRLINWSITWKMIGGANSPIFDSKEGKIFKENWLRNIFEHSCFIANYFSRFSSANNHLIGEAAGLYVASIIWPYWQTSAVWERQAKEILESEVVKQTWRDGVNKEQAISYQQFVLDFLLIAALTGKQSDSVFSDQFWQVISQMIAYLAAIIDVGNNIPMFGDADDGYVVQLSQQPEFNHYVSLITTGKLLFDEAIPKPLPGKLDDKTIWMLGASAKGEADNKDGLCQTGIRQSFPDGGYWILGDSFNTPSEVKAVVDCGSLGYLSIAAHGHADSLSLYLSVSGKEFLIDPGTYSYHTEREWREYFRGTRAHNTITVDGQDQSVITGNFMWGKKAVSACTHWKNEESVTMFKGEHNGYMRLADPVLHTREVNYDKKRCVYRIEDIIECKAAHFIEQSWHFSEECDVSVEGACVRVINKGIRIELMLDQASVQRNNFQVKKYTASTSPVLGWVSRKFDHKTGSSTVVLKGSITGKHKLTTIIRTNTTQ